MWDQLPQALAEPGRALLGSEVPAAARRGCPRRPARRRRGRAAAVAAAAARGVAVAHGPAVGLELPRRPLRAAARPAGRGRRRGGRAAVVWLLARVLREPGPRAGGAAGRGGAGGVRRRRPCRRLSDAADGRRGDVRPVRDGRRPSWSPGPARTSRASSRSPRSTTASSPTGSTGRCCRSATTARRRCCWARPPGSGAEWFVSLRGLYGRREGLADALVGAYPDRFTQVWSNGTVDVYAIDRAGRSLELAA